MGSRAKALLYGRGRGEGRTHLFLFCRLSLHAIQYNTKYHKRGKPRLGKLVLSNGCGVKALSSREVMKL